MSFTTRCPACSTTFKLVADQLLVAQGWVRCGHCGEVFDASLQGVPEQAAGPGYLGTGPAHGAMPALKQAIATQEKLQLEPESVPDFSPGGSTGNPADTLAGAALPTARPIDSTPYAPTYQSESGSQPARQALHQSAQRSDGDIALPVLPAAKLSAPVTVAHGELHDSGFTNDIYSFKLRHAKDDDLLAAFPEAGALPEPEQVPEEENEVSFVRAARRKSVWQKPLVRAVLGSIFLLLLAALALQWMVQKKDLLAAQEPRLASLIQALCQPLGCEIRPLRRIESVVIDSSNFSKTGADAYHLSFVFKNTSAAALEIPALEVTLTDSQGQPLLRRVLLPAQFGATAAVLAARSELAGAVALKVSSGGAQAAAAPAPSSPLPVTGYRILAFYP